MFSLSRTYMPAPAPAPAPARAPAPAPAPAQAPANFAPAAGLPSFPAFTAGSPPGLPHAQSQAQQQQHAAAAMHAALQQAQAAAAAYAMQQQQQQQQQHQLQWSLPQLPAFAASPPAPPSFYAPAPPPVAAPAPAPSNARALLISGIAHSVADADIALAVASLGPVEAGTLHVSRKDSGQLRPSALAVVVLVSAEDAARAVARGLLSMGASGTVGTVGWYQ